MAQAVVVNDASAAELLGPLEQLMTEFFSLSSENARKRDIEEMLKNFEKQPNSWKYCMYFVKTSNNHYVSMFALTTIENYINKRWSTLSFHEKDELKYWLWEHFTGGFCGSLTFLRNKLAKLIIDIARNDWPSAYPTFFNQMIELVERGGQTPILGLVMIQAFAEGFGNIMGTEPRLSHLTQERRRELQQLLQHYIPQLLSILTGILDKLAFSQSFDNHFSNPPPSPEKGNTSALSTPTVGLPDLLVSSHNVSRGDNKENKEECIKVSLITLQHLFSCLAQASHLPPTILPSIFHWASIATQNEFGEDVCIVGMSAINEMLYQRHTSAGNATVPRLTHETLKLLHHLTTPSHASPLTTLSQMYIDKIAEFLQLFISLYFKRLDSEPEFDSMGFLLLVFQFTFQVPSPSSFICCLDIWLQFIDMLKPQDSLKFSEALLGLVRGILNKLQFQQNSSQLQQLDNESVNDDGETEWQVFLRNCVECIAKIAELAPYHIFKNILEIWHELAELHDNASASIQELLDLASLTQLLGRLAPTLFQDKEDSSNDQSVIQPGLFLERLMKVLQCANSMCVNIHSQPKSMADAYVQVHAGVMACMGSWTHYMPRCTAPSCAVPVLLQIAASLLLNRNEKQHPPVLCHAAAHMLLSTTVSMHPTDPLQHISDLYIQAQRSLVHLQPKTASVVRQALCMMILECPTDSADNGPSGIEGRKLQACASLIAAWCSSLLASPSNVSPGRRLACLPALTHLLNYFADHPTQTKKLLAAAVERPVQAALEVFQNYNYEVENNEDGNVAPLVLELFLALLNALHQQLGNTFIRNSIHMFLDVAKRKEKGALQQLLRVLRVGVEGGALANTAALEEVLTMCLEHVLPLINSNEMDTDAIYALFDLFGSILLNRWQHFYSSCVRQGWSPVAPDGAGDGVKVAHLPQFRAIMYAISSSFLTDNIEVVRLNLRTMDFLNMRCKLYSKVVFRQELLCHMLGILIGLLIQNTAVGTLLQEEVCITCYNLAAVDFSAYFGSFLPSYLTSIPCITEVEIQDLLRISKDTDLPTFTQNLLRLTNEIRCYQMVKESHK